VDAFELVAALLIAAQAGAVGEDFGGGRVFAVVVVVAAGCVGLPDVDDGVGQRSSYVSL
jgi:hypothetical protein